jgi:arylsulfatase A-like enzyme
VVDNVPHVPRPNIVVVMPDQLRADAVGAFSSTGAQTPHLDELASRGTRFTQAFSQHSVCGPSRTSIFTGWYPHVAGHRTLDNLLKPWEPNLLRMFKDAGYHVAWAGMRGDTFAPGVTKTSTDFMGYTVKPRHTRWPSPPVEGALADANCWYSGLRSPRDGEADVLDLDEAAIQTCEQLLADGMPEPWLLFVALVFPHPPFAVEEPWWSLHSRDAMSPPLPPLLDDKPAFMRAMREEYRLDLLGPDDWAELKATYYGMVSRVDAQLGRVVAGVDRAGAASRTAWTFFTDHGEYMGDYGLVEKWASGLNDCLLRNPLIIATPDASGGGACDELVELVDVLPTLAELGEVRVEHSQFGRSLAPLLLDPQDADVRATRVPHRDAAFSEGGHRNDEPHVLEAITLPPYAAKAAIQQRDPLTVGKAVAMRTREWTFVHRLYESDELYDRVTDAGELVNLSGRPEVAAVEHELRGRVLDWLLSTGDVVPWTPDPRFPPE